MWARVCGHLQAPGPAQWPHHHREGVPTPSGHWLIGKGNRPAQEAQLHPFQVQNKSLVSGECCLTGTGKKSLPRMLVEPCHTGPVPSEARGSGLPGGQSSLWGPGGNDSRGHRKAPCWGMTLPLSWPCAGAGTQAPRGLQPRGSISAAALRLVSLPPRNPGPGSAVYPLLSHCLSVISLSPSTLTNKRPRASRRNPPPRGEPPDTPGTACARLRDTYWLAQVSVGFRLHFPDVVAV